jgi:uncharacterized protein
MNSPYRWVAVVWLMSMGVGWSSTPIRYYTLTPPLDKGLPAPETSLAIDMRAVHIPQQLNRAELLVRNGPTQLTLLENERWASPVQDEIKDAVRAELRRRLGMTGWHSALTKLTLDIDVQHLEAQLGQYALLEVSWSASLFGSSPHSPAARITTCTFRADVQIGSGYAAVVEAYQREIAALADAIVATFTADGSCSKDH